MDISKSSTLTTIVGFIYLLALFFFVLFLFDIRDLDFIPLTLPYAPYIVIVVILFSFLSGLTIYLLINEIIVPKLKKLKVYLLISKLFFPKFKQSITDSDEEK